MTDEMRHEIGGNFPPVVSEQEFRQWQERKAALLQACEDALKSYISTDKQQARALVELVKMCNVFCTTVEAKRKETKAPILEAGKACDAQFTEVTWDIQGAAGKLKDAVKLFMDWDDTDQLRTERGAVASCRREWAVESLDRRKLNLNLIRSYFTDECVRQAALAYANDRDRHDHLKGVKFKKVSMVVIR